MTVSNIFKQSNMQWGNVSVENLILLWKSLFLNEGTFTRISFVQDERDIWNEMTCRVSANFWFIQRIKIL